MLLLRRCCCVRQYKVGTRTRRADAQWWKRPPFVHIRMFYCMTLCGIRGRRVTPFAVRITS